MRGILKNVNVEDAKYRNESANVLTDDMPLDREQVIKNTIANSKLAAPKTTTNTAINEDTSNPLKWDEQNLVTNEREKSATMVIDEPKTPYEGGFDVNNDYYRTDNEGEDDFDLGEGVDDEDIPGEEIEEVEVELTPEEKHRRFEERRRQHYAHKADPLKRH